MRYLLEWYLTKPISTKRDQSHNGDLRRQKKQATQVRRILSQPLPSSTVRFGWIPEAVQNRRKTKSVAGVFKCHQIVNSKSREGVECPRLTDTFHCPDWLWEVA